VIEDLLAYLKIENMRGTGSEIQGRCPLHEKRTGTRELRPDNWSINRNTGRFHCFSCGYSGSLVKLVMDLDDVGLWDAHRLIREHDVDLDIQTQDDWQPLPSNQIEEQLEAYGAPPQRALLKRRLTRESVDKFGVRFDYEDAAWVLPITGPDGALWGFQFKAWEFVRNRPPGVKKSRTLFGLHNLHNASVILVESPLDAVYLDGLGYPAVASFGANVSDQQMRLLIERCDEVMLALDNDAAGINETRRLLAEKWHHRIPISIFHYLSTKKKDPGEMGALEVRYGVEKAVMASFWTAP